MDKTELMKRYEAETGQSSIECIDVSTMGHRILTRVKEEFLQWADKFVKEEEDL